MSGTISTRAGKRMHIQRLFKGYLFLCNNMAVYSDACGGFGLKVIGVEGRLLASPISIETKSQIAGSN